MSLLLHVGLPKALLRAVEVEMDGLDLMNSLPNIFLRCSKSSTHMTDEGFWRQVLLPLPFLDHSKGFGFILVWNSNIFLISKIFWDKATISCPALQ